jgi:tetratricopeptide (TPR) repeat protein
MSRINWREELNLNDDHIEDLRIAGYAYIRQGKYDIALSFFQTLALMNLEDPYDFQTLGALYLQLGDPKKAVTNLNRALQLDTDHSATLLNLAKALFMLGKTEEGLKLAEILSGERDPFIANPAKALMLAFG